MRVRVRMWWEFLPFTAKAALIVVVTGLSVTVSARAATPLLGGGARTAAAAPQHRVARPVAHPTAPVAAVELSSFRPPAPRRALRVEREARHAPRMHARRGESRHHARRATTPPSTPADLENEAQSHADIALGTLRNAAPFHRVPPAGVRP